MTGYQGSSVVRALVKNGSYHIKAITRNPESEKAKKLVGLEKVTKNFTNLRKSFCEFPP